MIFTEKQLDGAAILVAAEAMTGLPESLEDFLTQSQLSELHDEIRDVVKESLLFSLMNHLAE